MAQKLYISLTRLRLFVLLVRAYDDFLLDALEVSVVIDLRVLGSSFVTAEVIELFEKKRDILADGQLFLVFFAQFGDVGQVMQFFLEVLILGVLSQ